MEWLTEDQLRCSGCGMPRDESMRDEDTAPSYEAKPLKCWACEVREQAMRDAIELNQGKPLPGWHWLIHERNGANHG